MEPLISVIVPVYRVEPYLRRCVDSILEQTYHNLEVILVDDGSPDACGSICDEYAEKDCRVRVIHKANGGLSDARNAGLAIMTGQYVAFVDSDDWIGPGMYETLMGLLRQFDADMAVCSVADELDQGDRIQTVKTSDYGPSPFSEGNVDAMRRYFHGSWAAWDKLYRAELFAGIRYPVGEINEDEAIVLRLLDKCRKIAYTNEVFYHYIRRQDSITTSVFSVRQMAWPRHCRENLGYIQEHHPELELDAAARYRGSILWALREIALSRDDFEAETRQLRQQLKEYGHLLGSAPYKNKADKLRFWMMRWLPFGLNRWLLRARHRI